MPNSIMNEQVIPVDVVLKTKRWRVGAISMGVAMLIIGTLLLISQWKGTDVWEVAILWWPLVFILLGIEILVNVVLARKKDERVYYDLVSIFFIGLLGMVCLGFAVFSSLGLTHEFRQMISATEHSMEVQELHAEVGPHIQKIIIQSNRPYYVKVDSTSTDTVHVMGYYRSTTRNADEADENYVKEPMRMKEIGEVMYLFVKEPPQKHWFQSGNGHLDLTVVVPNEVDIEIRDASGNRFTR